MQIILRLIYRFNAILIKISRRHSVDVDKLAPSFVWEDTGHSIAKTSFKKNKIGGTTLADIKAYHVPTVIGGCDNDGQMDTVPVAQTREQK